MAGPTQKVDVTGADAEITANAGDVHDLRLSNPVGQSLIVAGVTYEADFTAISGATPIDLDQSEKAAGILTATITIADGTIRIRRLNPRRTILTVEIKAR